MKSNSNASHALTWLAIAGLCVPPATAIAHEPKQLSAHNIRDIALAPGGLITGRVIDTNQRPLPDTEVAILVPDATVATTHTDADGYFAVSGLRGGVHQVRTPRGSAICRLWAPGTAPPCAADSLRISPAKTIVRGQGGQHFVDEPFPHARAIATHPLTVGGLLAAAVAIPAAMHNADEPPGS